MEGPDSAFTDFSLYDILGPGFVQLGRKALLDVAVLEELVKARAGDGFIHRALLPFARKLVYLSDAGARTDSVRMEGIFHNTLPNVPTVLSCAAPPFSLWAARGVTDVGHLYNAASGCPLTVPQLYNRFRFSLPDQQEGSNTPFRIPDRRRRGGGRTEYGHSGALLYAHHALGSAGANMGPMLSPGVVWRQIRDRGGADLPNQLPAFFARLSPDQLLGGPARFDPPPQEVLQLVAPYTPGRDSVDFRVRRLDESLHLASDDGAYVSLSVIEAVVQHRRVVIKDGRFAGFACAGAAIAYDMGVKTDSSAGRVPDSDHRRYTSIAEITTNQLGASLYPSPQPAVELRFLAEWKQLASEHPAVLDSARLTGPQGALARNAGSVLHLPRKKQLMHRILLRALTLGRHVRNFALEGDRDRCAGCRLKTETLEHMLWECDLVHKVWIHALNTLDRLRGVQHPEWCDSRNAFSLAVGSGRLRYLRAILTDTPRWKNSEVVGDSLAPALRSIWHVLRMEVVWSIWAFRCAARDYGDGARMEDGYTEDDILRKWQAAVRQRVLEERVMPSSPELSMDSWLAHGAIATLAADSTLVFHADIGGCARLFTEEEVEGAQDGFFPGRLPVIVADDED